MDKRTKDILTEEEPELFVGIGEWRALRDLPVWKDYVTLVQTFITRWRDDLEIAGPGTDDSFGPGTIPMIQGQLYGARLLLDIPAIMIETITDKKEEEEDGEAGE